MRQKTLRLPDELSEEITRRARIKGVPDADYTRLLIERGLLLEGVEMVTQARDNVYEVAASRWCAQRYSVGNTSNVRNVADTSPPITTTASGR